MHHRAFSVITAPKNVFLMTGKTNSLNSRLRSRRLLISVGALFFFLVLKILLSSSAFFTSSSAFESSSRLALLTTVGTNAPVPTEKPVRILYVIRTCPKFYETRLRLVLETYLTKVPAGEILVVGNDAHSLNVSDGTQAGGNYRSISVLPTVGDGGNIHPCLDNHAEGVTCIEGRGLFYAFERAQREELDWIFVVDDDVFVHRRNLEKAALGLSISTPHVFTVGGCAPNAQCSVDAGGGICGGGGYLLSVHNLKKTVCGSLSETSNILAGSSGSECRIMAKEGQLLRRWMNAWMSIGAIIFSQDGSWWSDITAGCVFHKLGGLKTKQMPGLHPSAVKAKELIRIFAEELPLSFHYVDRDEMPGMFVLHKLFG